jgi:hypothetical protein
MPEALSLALVPLVFGLTVIGPGLLLVRRRTWDPIEKATAALALSILLVGQLSFACGVLRLSPAVRILVLAACAAATCASLPAIARRVRSDAETRRVLLGFAVLLVWALSLQAVVRNYAGGNLVYDWLDHYERSKFFLGEAPLFKPFSGALLPARPPLLNAFAAQVLALTRTRFACYQMTAGLLGVLAYFPILLVARLFSRARTLPGTLAIALMFQPMFVQNVSYSWTRLTAVFFVLAAVAFYVGGWRAADAGRTVFAFLCGAAAILTHYSSAPYVLFLALHFLLFVLPRRERPLRQLAGIAAAAAIVLGPWLLWSSAVYGGGATIALGFLSSGRPLPGLGANLAKAALNLRDTFVPHLFREVPRHPASEGAWGRLHDDTFLMYQGNLPLALGALGAILLAIEAARSLRRTPPGPRADTARFWCALAAFVILTGIGVQGGREPFGLAHTAQQPLVMLGVAFLVARFEGWPRWLRLLAAAGMLCDAVFGVLMHFWMQSYPIPFDAAWRGPLGLTQQDLTSMMAGWNWGEKIAGPHLFVADALGGLVWLPRCLVATLFLLAAGRLLRRAGRPGVAPRNDRA